MKMKLYNVIYLCIIISATFCACGTKQDLADMNTKEGDGYVAISWNDKTYVPYCAFSKNKCGRQIGIVDGDEDDKVFEYNGYSSDEWIINYYANNMDTVMLLREINVTDIPDGMQSEYEWNSNQSLQKEEWDLIPMVMINGQLYMDTGYEVTEKERANLADGKIISEIDGSKQPKEDDQSNFGTGYEYQYTEHEGLIEIHINGKWFVFATQEALASHTLVVE